MTIDIHRYLGQSLFGYKTSPSQILRDMDKLAIEKTILVPVKPKGYKLAPECKRVAQIVAKHPDRFMGWCRVDPWQGERAVAELQMGITQLGLVGLFLHPWEENFQIDSELVDPLMRAAAQLKIPVMIVGGHVRQSTAWQIADLAGRHQKVTIIATSGGQINISGAALHEAELMFAEHPNVMMETSGIYREDFIEDTAKKIGSQRVLWGSGSPIYDVAFEIKRGEWAHIPEDDKTNILFRNAERLFGRKS